MRKFKIFVPLLMVITIALSSCNFLQKEEIPWSKNIENTVSQSWSQTTVERTTIQAGSWETAKTAPYFPSYGFENDCIGIKIPWDLNVYGGYWVIFWKNENLDDILKILNANKPNGIQGPFSWVKKWSIDKNTDIYAIWSNLWSEYPPFFAVKKGNILVGSMMYSEEVDNVIISMKNIVSNADWKCNTIRTNGFIRGSHEIDSYIKGNLQDTTTSISSKQTQEIEARSPAFFNTQSAEILSKIEKITKEQQTQERVRKNILQQGDFRAEYIPMKNYLTDTDKIIVTISGSTYTLPGVYGEKEKAEFLKCVKGTNQTTPSVECGAMGFGGFNEFSPSGNYLTFFSGFYEWGTYTMIDVRTGKVVISEPGMFVRAWTNDRAQFIYGSQSGIASGPGLYITKRGGFPNFTTIQETDDVMGLYVDSDFIYTKLQSIENNDRIRIAIYDLKTLKEVFTKDVVK